MAETKTQLRGWKETTLGEVAEIFTGRKDVNQTNPNGKYTFFSCSPEFFYSDDYIRDDDAIIIVGNGSYTGTVRFFSGKFDLYQRTYACVLKEETKKSFDIKFIFYYIKKYFEKNFMGGSRGSSIPYIVRGDIENFEIPMPPLPEQHSIAGVLGSLDDKIELLREQNETLEAIARAIFHEWFVEFNFPFNFVQGKPDEGGKPYKASGGKMVDSELGEIPEGWRVGKVEDLCERLASGGTPSTKNKEYYGGEIPWFSTKELNDNFLFDSEKNITDVGLENSSAKLFPAGTVLMAIYASPTVGRLGILAQEAAFNQAAVGLVADENVCSNTFIYFYLLSKRDALNNLTSGAAQQNLNVELIKNFLVTIPDNKTMSKFREWSEPIFNTMLNNASQLRELARLRDTLLPKLMSGEVRVNK
ncbi:hypothetical protein A3C05_03460 [Candidatus Giovannonibacteria bacterium RIFCSPHIGHO2_02_FULL_45_40]|uniref:Type I restriction modification DNA specificity domain-containing protein n=1 Tax=Candidatus Giovannonibacteria bacterium RIFCSPHIGHO2_02_FULL_45_40 TaxID=1798337 RepID=A0A1F5WAA8_9BACT|nr:MAG: hypothetical protein A2656_01185 [Candidatus Giovannonibacteria bacterium RIFCSPHIGHO2_01_FULL_44_100]OGF72596.1 MAG: hypothetical protein A3C05_03460 [Candidatus Giovannonibacteria bacterium RIFCSPHIGHO2_02_FULL_45_40]